MDVLWLLVKKEWCFTATPNQSRANIYLFYFLSTLGKRFEMMHASSSETQGQIVGAWESLNGRENIAQRKIKNGEKSPWGQCLTRPVLIGHRRSGFWLVPENFCVFLPNKKPERRRPFGTGLVRHCPQGLFSPFFTFLCAIFFQPLRLSHAPTICPWVSEDVHACENFRVDDWGGGGQWGWCGGVDRVRRDVEKGFKLLPTVWFLS